jgi:hypothetical protein
MTAIEATSVRVQTMADDTLRLVVDIEPRFANQAFQLFGKAGQAIALAALKRAPSEPVPKAEERPFRGELCRWTAIRCEEPAFAAWLESAYPAIWAEHFPGLPANEAAAECVRNLCGVASRRELDTNEAAAALLHSNVRKPYAAWLKANPAREQ